MSEGTGSADVSEVSRACTNCENYDWSQPADLSKLLTCSKCRFLSYCSRECQLEHWVKVHKQHCKYLADQKVMPQSRHYPVNCSTCVERAKIGLAELSSADNPTLCCPFPSEGIFVPTLHQPDYGNGVRTTAHIPFQLGEMSGQFPTMAEQTVSILGHLLLKLDMIKHPAWTILPGARSTLCFLLREVRELIWNFYINTVPGHRLDWTIQTMLTDSSSSPGFLLAMFAQVDKIDEKLTEGKFVDKSVFRPWDAFKLLLNMLLQYGFDYQKRDAERLGIEDDVDEITEVSGIEVKLRVTSTQFSEIWSKLLSTMSGKLVPYEDLVKIICNDQLNQVCFGCSEEITVSEIIFSRRKDMESKKVVPFKFQGDAAAFFCADPLCYDGQALGSRFWQAHSFITHLYMRTSFENRFRRCDYCSFPSKGCIHRCTGCLTKLYCGEQCRDEDWEMVHSKVCKQGEVRKVKGGKQEREEDVSKRFDEFVEQVERMDVDDKARKPMEGFVMNLKGCK